MSSNEGGRESVDTATREESRKGKATVKSKHHACRICGDNLPDSYLKPNCDQCVQRLLAQEQSTLFESMRMLIQQEVRSSVQEIRRSLRSENSPGTSRQLEDSGPSSGESSESEEEDRSGRPLVPIEDIDHLVKLVRSTMELEDEKEERSVTDVMFQGLGEKKRKVFPIHENISSLIQAEWRKADKKVFIPRAMKRKYPFPEKETEIWDKAPKVDVAVSKVSRKSALPVEDSGVLKDPMDKKADGFLRRSWEAAAGAFKPNVAATCVSRSLLVWLSQLEEKIKAGASRSHLISEVTTAQKASAFLADASVDALRLSARSVALSNSARRALWLKNWTGDLPSKSHLCSIPCEGEFLFGSALDNILEKAADRKRGFPSTRPQERKFFRPSRRFRSPQRSGDKKEGWRPSRRSKGFMFSRPQDSSKRPGQQ
ncbi:uncharacterized protein [Engystomops pustulosus]|uniref:uncharacterized protein isoform X2 n=1 Tax=Engystomops pustulosus TaxID=76066 RepID=UPI003AFB245F